MGNDAFFRGRELITFMRDSAGKVVSVRVDRVFPKTRFSRRSRREPPKRSLQGYPVVFFCCGTKMSKLIVLDSSMSQLNAHAARPRSQNLVRPARHVSVLLILMAAFSPILAQQPVRLRPAPSNGFLKVVTAEGRLAIDMDREPSDPVNPISQWLLEAIPATQWFWIRHVATGQYLASASSGAIHLAAGRQDLQGPTAGLDNWTLERNIVSFSTGNVTLYRIRDRLTGRYLSATALVLQEPTTIDDWTRFDWQFTTPEGGIAPEAVAMTALQIAELQENQALQAQKHRALSIARAGQGCWLENDPRLPGERYVILLVAADTLIVQALEFDAGTSREGGAGWQRGPLRATYLWGNGVFSDGLASSLAFRDDRSAWKRDHRGETSLFRTELTAESARPRREFELSAEHCSALIRGMYR
jgi:hypothetical protein